MFPANRFQVFIFLSLYNLDASNQCTIAALWEFSFLSVFNQFLDSKRIMWKCLTPTMSSTSLMENIDGRPLSWIIHIWHQCTVGKCQHVHKENCGLSVVWSLRSKVSSWFLNNYSVRFWHVMVMAVAAVSSQSYRAKAFHITTEGQHTKLYKTGACLHFRGCMFYIAFWWFLHFTHITQWNQDLVAV